jgi:DNA-binding CsgD family transcriptional regulator
VARDDDSAGVIVIRSDGSITLCSEQARRWLAEWFGPLPAGPLALPAPLREWAARRISEESGGRRLRAVRPDALVTTRDEHCLVADLSVDHGIGLHLMRLEKVALSAPAASLRELGLTARESEVLCWVAQGKTNREVGLILGASARTVQKHLEHIFEKLGVESRTAAILKAWQVGRSAALA